MSNSYVLMRTKAPSFGFNLQLTTFGFLFLDVTYPPVN